MRLFCPGSAQAFRRPIVLGLEPPVRREHLHAEIDGEEPMVQVVKIAVCSHGTIAADDESVVAGVPDRRADAGVQQVEDRMNGLDGTIQLKKTRNRRCARWDASESRPRANVDVLMVQVMAELVQRLPVNQAVDEIEVEVAEVDHGDSQQDRVDRILAHVQVGNDLV